jgi:hypothetical protein
VASRRRKKGSVKLSQRVRGKVTRVTGWMRQKCLEKRQRRMREGGCERRELKRNVGQPWSECDGEGGRE